MFSEEEKSKVWEATKDSFHENGLKEMTLADISEKAGISEEKIKENYNSKDDIIIELMSRGIDDVSQILQKSIHSRGKADVKLSRFVKTLLRDYEIHAPLFRLVSMNFQNLDDECLELRKLLTQDQIDRYRLNTVIMGRLIAEGQSEGIFRKADPLECAYFLRGIIHGAIRFWQDTKMEGELGDFADRVMRIFLTGVYK